MVVLLKNVIIGILAVILTITSIIGFIVLIAYFFRNHIYPFKEITLYDYSGNIMRQWSGNYGVCNTPNGIRISNESEDFRVYGGIIIIDIGTEK